MPEYHATRVPTLLIGIGGIGGRIVREVDRSLRDYDKQFVQMLVLDTNTNDLDKVGSQNIPYIQTSENQTVSDYLRQNSTFTEWFPTNPLINSKNLTQGAGQIRSVSRLGALASESAHRFDRIKEAINEVNRNHGNTLHNMIRVMIVGSVCGGTGSGMGIQLPFLIRDQIQELANMPRVIIRGLFVMPDIAEEVQDTETKRSSVYVNGYSFLRELNGFYHAQTFEKGTEKLNIEHYNNYSDNFTDDPTTMAKQVPYDFLFLVEKSDKEGQNIGRFDDYLVKAADIVRAQLFASQITADAHSTEDNLIVGLVDTNGMRRYCGAGISKAVYPEDENIRYCTLKYAESILQGYWMQIDDMVAKNVAQHKKQMAVDLSLQPLDPQKEYRRVFDDLTDPQKHNVSLQFGALKRELFKEAEIKDNNGNPKIQTINCPENLARSIHEFVEKSFKSSALEQKASECIPSGKILDDPQQAASHVSGKLLLLRNYEKEADSRVGQLTSSCIEAILPSDLGSAQSYSDETKNQYSIFAILQDKHPIIARYILYYVKEELINRKAYYDAKITSLKKEDTVFTTDYYKEKKGKDTNIEDPGYALQLVNPGIFNSLRIFSSEYTQLVKKIKRDFPAHTARINNLSVAKLCSSVYDGVIKRIDLLVGRLEKFFGELGSVLISRQKERKSFEDNNNRIRNSNVYVCCDNLCREWFYNKFNERLLDADQTLPTEIKKSFFTTIFGEYAKKLSKTLSSTIFVDAEISMEKLFEDSILTPMINKFKDVEFGDMNLNIIEAIHLEYTIHKNNGGVIVNDTPITDPNYTKEDYFASVASQIQELARPYFSYSPVSEAVNRMIFNNNYGSNTLGRVLYFFGLNNGAVLNHQHTEEVDRGALRAMFGPEKGTTSVVNDDSYDKRELVCYSSIYDFSIENLDKYRKGGRAYREYMNRMDSIQNCSYDVGTGEDQYLQSVHPHLDKNWHKHSYLPALHIDEELEMQQEIRTAFLLSVACNRCRYIERDETKRWTFRRNEGITYDTLTLDNKPAVRASYLTLYRVLDENSLVVKEILAKEKEDVKNAYDSIRIYGVDIASLLEQPIIKGFIGRILDDEEKADLQKAFEKTGNVQPINIIDVIFTMYKDSYDIDLVKNLMQTLSKYLQNYCLIMTNRQPGLSQKLYQEIARRIGENQSAELNDDFRSICKDFIQ